LGTLSQNARFRIGARDRIKLTGEKSYEKLRWKSGMTKSSHTSFPDTDGQRCPCARMWDLTGKHALVTGAGGGIGRAITSGLACHGADVACLDLTAEIAAIAVQTVKGHGREGLPIACDVRCPEAISAAVEQALDTFGKIDILVNLAGKGILKPALSFTLADWTHMVDTYLRGTFLMCQTVGRHMVERGSGSIINISSVASVVALGRGTAPYSAVKAGVNALTRELAVEWSRTGVRVNAIAPCQIDTPELRSVLNDPQFLPEQLMDTWLNAIPLGRLGKPEEIAGPCIFLASDLSSLITGHILMVDGGYTIK
jgi:NAD(P)-dependent dehydrogenase (short-subunit alcohol dehydrogenase family)